MERIKCQYCGELIDESLVNLEERVAFCRHCGDFTYFPEGLPLLPLIPLRELLDNPPPNVRLTVRMDGTRVFTIRPYETVRGSSGISSWR